MLRTSLYRHLAVSILECCRLNGDARRRRTTAKGRLHRYRIASRFIDDHASLPISVEDIARAAGVSSEELDSIFRGHPRPSAASSPTCASHKPPRRTRTSSERARRTATPSARAHRWGYAHPSTFAEHHREQYGINPKHVLDR